MTARTITIILIAIIFALPTSARPAVPHSLVIEAETLAPLKGANFSFQQTDKTTKGSWSLAGPGVAAEWTQGGESDFLSIAARADEPAGLTASREIEIPAKAEYTLWVRYADYRKRKESFGVAISQGGKEMASHTFGEQPKVDELDPMLLLWDFAFTWDQIKVTLEAGPASVKLFTTGPTEARRHIDLLVLTIDAAYQPTGREKPDAPAFATLRALRRDVNAATRISATPEPWKIAKGPPTFVWNTGQPWLEELKRGDDRIDVPFGVDPPLLKDFLAAFRGKSIPVYGSPLSGPSWHIPLYPTVFADNSPFIQYLERNPKAHFSLLLNYGAPGWPDKGTPAEKQAAYANLQKYNDRCVGYVAGESIAHESYDHAALDERVKAAKSRADVLTAFRQVHTDSVVKKFTNYYGRPVTPAQAWAPVISCLSANNEAFAHALLEWGCRRVGHENTGNSPTLARRLAFLRGAARQFGAKFADYQSANLGDSATMFSREAYFFPASSRNILDNSYDAWAGAGLNWLLKDYLLFHLAGCDVFYNEQGVDIFYKPGGGAAGDNFPVQLSPKGKVAQAVLELAEKHPRGTQYTPVAFLLDHAHGYSQERFTPGAFGLDPQLNPAVLMPNRHEAALRAWFDLAYFPAPDTQNEPATAIRQTFVNGVFGDIFDVLVTAPSRTDILKTYSVLIAIGDIPLTEEWGQALNAYLEAGGTLVTCANTFTGPGAAALKLPQGPADAQSDTIQWANQPIASNVFRHQTVAADNAKVVASTPDGKPLALAINRDKGKLFYIAIPLGLGIDNRPTPLLAHLLNQLTAPLYPVGVTGDVETIYNRLDDGSWVVTLLNNKGITKPQHGVLPTDHRQTQEVTLTAPFKVTPAPDQLTGAGVTWQDMGNRGSTARVIVPAGAVRIIPVVRSK